MCGIVGYVGPRPARELLLASLERLEYRGYDSAGISVLSGGRVECVRAVGNLAALRARVEGGSGPSRHTARRAAAGIGHTRWATHGRVSEANAHPHFDAHGRVHVVVNGIVENYVELRRELREAGVEFRSETDAEVIAHLIGCDLNGGGLEHAVRTTLARLRGHYAFVALSASEPDTLVAARKDCPLIVGRGDGEQLVASAIAALVGHTRSYQPLENGDLVVLRPDGAEFRDGRGVHVQRRVQRFNGDRDAAEKAGYESFMLKEIHEQPEAVAATLAGRTKRGDGVDLEELGAVGPELLRHARRVVLLGCGTSYHAGLIARYAFEHWLRIPVEADLASEYRYREPVVGPGDLVVGISQSGETADTLAGMRLARERGATVLAVTNVVGSQATVDADGVLFTRAGLEIGVAATKTFLAQVVALYLLGLRIAELRGTVEPARLRELVAGLERLPGQIEELLAGTTSSDVERVVERHGSEDFFLYLGRHFGLGVCLEGALKLKEISYVAADAYAAGEMKHGPIALLSCGTPVVVVATDSPVLDKVVSNIQQVRARGACVIAVNTAGNGTIAEHADEVLPVPASDWMLQPMLAVIPLQLLAYRMARARGLDVDRPRNLAKTVTVE